MPAADSSTNTKALTQRRFELITLGDELLLGLTANSHLTFIGAQLGRRGVQLARNVTITDEAAEIERQFRESWASADVIITTGGLGPTCDDRTREVIAGVLGQALVFEPEIEAAIKERFNRLGLRTLPPNNLKQAYRFERGEVLPNAHGTAPGLWVEQEGRILCMLPGPPNELQPMFTDQVLPRLAARGLLLEGEAYVQLRTAGIGESELEARLQPVFDRYGGGREGGALSVAFCAHAGQVDCRLSSPGGALAGGDLSAIAEECAGLLGEDFMCYGDASMAKVCVDLLRSQEQSLAVAEAGTGGLLASAFGDICGVAKCFAGGVVCNSNEAKVALLDCPECLISQHGAVSASCAVALAIGVAEHLCTDYALSITAFSGAPCADARGSEVGTLFVGLHAPHGVWAKKLSYPGPPQTIKTRAVNAALDWLRRELLRSGSRGR
ncbi:damage-inducible protein CinA [Cephaloticoccus primus]|uniref:CinA-like protein n=1 Tax=Cephaloticoccus primus TaxID=1548207 RepID=A0A139SQP8_9BACT|nr:CinA family nicotinamide mononucleotide deamidase-related protein [Cephaloticoccus primus]KXU36834.1 damage-inducible protein CinA [Cephaloticoccus primus]